MNVEKTLPGDDTKVDVTRIDRDTSAREDPSLLFDQARRFLRPGPFYRAITYLYSQRKIFVLQVTHAALTIIIWSTFTERAPTGPSSQLTSHLQFISVSSSMRL